MDDLERIIARIIEAFAELSRAIEQVAQMIVEALRPILHAVEMIQVEAAGRGMAFDEYLLYMEDTDHNGHS